MSDETVEQLRDWGDSLRHQLAAATAERDALKGEYEKMKDVWSMYDAAKCRAEKAEAEVARLREFAERIRAAAAMPDPTEALYAAEDALAALDAGGQRDH